MKSTEPVIVTVSPPSDVAPGSKYTVPNSISIGFNPFRVIEGGALSTTSTILSIVEVLLALSVIEYETI